KKRLETLSKTQLVNNLGSANISDLNPLCKDGFLIVYLNRILCLEKVISMYEKCGQQHAWVDKPVGFLDNLSYISINIYIQIANRVFSCENLVGGKIAIHITLQEVVYFLGIRSYTDLDT
ncbi:10813_t:CDS:2, partial [Gigaspora rosea]